MKLKPLFIVWDDSCAYPGWTPIEDFGPRPALCISVGFLVHEDKRSVTITNALTEFNDVNDPLTIPKSAILKKQFIKFDASCFRKVFSDIYGK